MVALAKQMMRMDYSIHFYVWNFDEFECFLRFLKDTYIRELEVVEAVLNKKEGIFILRKA